MTVPVVLVVTKTLANSDSFVTKFGDGFEHELCELVGGFMDDVMRDGDCRVLFGSHTWRSHVALEPVERVLEGVSGLLLVVIRIKLEVDDVVTHILHKLLTTRLSRATRVRRADVSRDLSNNVVQCALHVEDLVPAEVCIDLGQVEMRPCVGCNLMSLCIHALYHIDVLLGFIDLPFAIVVASDEEGRFCVVLFEQIQDSCGRILHRSVIVSDSDLTRVFASPESTIDTVASIGN